MDDDLRGLPVPEKERYPQLYWNWVDIQRRRLLRFLLRN